MMLWRTVLVGFAIGLPAVAVVTTLAEQHGWSGELYNVVTLVIGTIAIGTGMLVADHMDRREPRQR